MAKVIVTLQDKPSGNVIITHEYERTFDSNNPTAAEYIAMQFIMHCDDEAKKVGS